MCLVEIVQKEKKEKISCTMIFIASLFTEERKKHRKQPKYPTMG